MTKAVTYGVGSYDDEQAVKATAQLESFAAMVSYIVDEKAGATISII